MSDEHSIIPPSASDIWGPVDGCRLYPQMALIFPEEERESAVTGRVSHTFGEKMIRKHIFDEGEMPIRKDVVGACVDDVIVTHDMYDGAQVYATEVVRLFNSLNIPNKQLRLEHRVSCPDIHDEMFGTMDAEITGDDYIHNIDFKSGRIPVNADGNLQQTCYISGTMSEMEINGSTDQNTRVVKTIIQPFANDHMGPIRRWIGMGSDLRNDINILKKSALEVFGPDPLVRSGDHCCYCPGRFACSVALSSMENLAEMSTISSRVFVQNDMAALAANYSVAKRAESRIKKIRESLMNNIEAAIRSGKQVPGFEMNTKEGGLAYQISDDDVIAIGDDVGIPMYKKKLLTPKQAIQEGVPESIVHSIAKRTKSQVITEVNINKAKEVFYGNPNS